MNVSLSLLRKVSSVTVCYKGEIKYFLYTLRFSSEKKTMRVKDKRSTIHTHGKLFKIKKEKFHSFLEREREREPKVRLKVPMTECYSVSLKDLLSAFITSV